MEAFHNLTGLRKPSTRDIFERVAYVFPDDLRVSGYPRRVCAAFNPGAVLKGEDLHVFPRLIFDYYGYVSSIGLFTVNVEELLDGRVEKPLDASVVLWPKELWEFKGCEDARVYDGGEETLVLYTGFGYHPKGGDLEVKWVQGLASLGDGWEPLKRGFFSIRGVEGEYTPKMKDSALIGKRGGEAILLCRPTFDDVEVCWRGLANLNPPVVDAETMEPVLAPEEWEFKVGWSTNVLQLSSNEYMVGWHGVVKADYSYREGLAVLDSEGRLLAVSSYLLYPQGLVEEYGDRPLVVFGNGLVRYKEFILWVGGVSDYCIGFFKTEIEKTLENLNWVSG